MKPYRVRIVLEAPWSPSLACEVAETLTDFRLDGDRFNFLLVWFDTPQALRCQVVFDRLPEDAGLIGSIIGQGIASCFVG